MTTIFDSSDAAFESRGFDTFQFKEKTEGEVADIIHIKARVLSDDEAFSLNKELQTKRFSRDITFVPVTLQTSAGEKKIEIDIQEVAQTLGKSAEMVFMAAKRHLFQQLLSNFDEIPTKINPTETERHVRNLYSKIQEISKISEDDFRAICKHIEDNKASLIEQAKASKNGVIYITHKQLPRALQVDSNGRILIHFNQGKKGDKILGTGGFKRVRLAVDYDSGKLFAVGSTVVKGDVERVMTERETQFLKLFEGERGVAQIVEEVKVIGKSGQEKSLSIQPFYSGGDLFDRLYVKKTPPLTVDEKLKITIDLLHGLAAIAKKKVIQRDIKLENVFLSRSESGEIEACIADFGLSCFINELEEKAKICGSTHGFSPEYATGICSTGDVEEVTTPAIDVWAFGCTLIELHTGHRALWAWKGSVEELVLGIADLQYTDIQLINSGIPLINELLQKCLAINPRERITAAGALAHYVPLLEKLRAGL